MKKPSHRLQRWHKINMGSPLIKQLLTVQILGATSIIKVTELGVLGDMEFSFVFFIIIFGLLLGAIVGLTSIGKGLIGIPVLILLGVDPQKAVGIIAIAGCFMMLAGVVKHLRNGYVHLKTVLVFSSTSVPLSYYFAMHKEAINKIIPLTVLIGGAIILSVMTLIYKFFINKKQAIAYTTSPKKFVLIAFLGAIMGFFIGVTSISGALIMILFMLFLQMPERLAIGSTALIALFSLTSASFAHIRLGDFDWGLLLVFTPAVMIGAYIGAHFTHVVPQKPMRIAILVLLIGASVGVFMK